MRRLRNSFRTENGRFRPPGHYPPGLIEYTAAIVVPFDFGKYFPIDFAD